MCTCVYLSYSTFSSTEYWVLGVVFSVILGLRRVLAVPPIPDWVVLCTVYCVYCMLRGTTVDSWQWDTQYCSSTTLTWTIEGHPRNWPVDYGSPTMKQQRNEPIIYACIHLVQIPSTGNSEYNSTLILRVLQKCNTQPHSEQSPTPCSEDITSSWFMVHGPLTLGRMDAWCCRLFEYAEYAVLWPRRQGMIYNSPFYPRFMALTSLPMPKDLCPIQTFTEG